MIKLCLINGQYSSLEGDLNLDNLMNNKQDDVILSCDELFPPIGKLERAAADFISSLLPYGYQVKWDEREVCTRNQKVDPRSSNPRISELRFRLILKNIE